MKNALLLLILIVMAPALASPGLERAPINGQHLTYQQRGEGEVILMIHGALVADSFLPVMDQPALEDFRLVRYRRSGYSDSASLDLMPEAFLDRTVTEALALLDHLNVDRAHVVGHSSGAIIAMAMALHAPDRVHSLVLLEPPMMMVPAAGALSEIIGNAASFHEAGDSAAAVDAFLTRLARPEWQALMSRQVPGSVDQAIGDADTFFELEVPGISAFEFDDEHAARLSMPALYVLGSESSSTAGADDFFEQGKELLVNKLPNAESVTLDGVDHSLQIGFPAILAPIIADFAARHPIED